MSNYQNALKLYLASGNRTQAALATAAATSQPNINRYVNGERFPDANMARRIESATNGEVPFGLWQREMAVRLGMGAATERPTETRDAA